MDEAGLAITVARNEVNGIEVTRIKDEAESHEDLWYWVRLQEASPGRQADKVLHARAGTHKGIGPCVFKLWQ